MLEGDQLKLVAVDRVPFHAARAGAVAKQADLAARGSQWFRDLALPEAIGVLHQGWAGSSAPRPTAGSSCRSIRGRRPGHGAKPS